MAADGRLPDAPAAQVRVRPRRRPAGPAAGAAGLAVALVAGLVALGGPGEPPVASPAPAVPAATAAARVADPDAVALLRRADEASRRLGWQGTQFVARWSEEGGTSALVDVVHVPGRGSLVRLASTPGSTGALVPEDPAPAPAAPLGLLQRHYVLREGGEGRCAGRAADVVEAWRRDEPAGTLAARFWLDRETGLVLRREVVDPAGHTVLASAFLDLQAPLARTPRGALAARSGGARLEAVDPEALRAEGWPVPLGLAGLDLHQARAGGAGRERLVHLAYSDGLLAVSVFAQPGELDPAALTHWEPRRLGAARVWVADEVPQRVAWSSGGTVFTVLVDAPRGTLDAAVAALPHDEARGLRAAVSAVRERLARGLAEVASRVGQAGA